MATLPVEVLTGIYLGVLTGIIPAVVAWALGFVFKYVTGVTIPALAVVVLAVAIAGVNGGLLAFMDPTISKSPRAEMLIVALLVVMMMSLYAHSQGDKLGASLPKRVSLRKLRDRTLSSDVVELVGGRGQVRITVAGEVEDVEGYPPLPPELREELRHGEWTFPADLPLAELETRLADKLRTDHDLTEVSVRIDERGRATIAAAPPTSGVSKRVPQGDRAVSIHALLPAGLARGDEVSIHLEDGAIRGKVVSAVSGTGAPAGEPAVETDGGTGPAEPAPAAPTVECGEGRLTVAVGREDARRLLAVEQAHVVVRARGVRREFELLSLLKRAGKRFRKVTVGAGSDLAGTTIGDAAVRDVHGVAVLAVRRPDGWTLAPRGSTEIGAGDELFVVGPREALDRFAGVAT